MTKAESCTLRRILDKIANKFGEYAYLELYEDGSGFIHDRIKKDSVLAQFDGLGELSTILETPLIDMTPYYTSHPGGGHGKW